MFELSRTKRMRTVLSILSAISFALCIIALAKGGSDSLFNYPFATVLMFIFAGLALVFLLGALCLSALSKDVKEELKDISEKNRRIV